MTTISQSKSWQKNLKFELTMWMNMMMMMIMMSMMMIMTMKNILKFETTVITLENKGALLIISVTSDTKHQKQFLWCAIMVLHDYDFIIKKLTEELKG